MVNINSPGVGNGSPSTMPGVFHPPKLDGQDTPAGTDDTKIIEPAREKLVSFA
jgi:hypothetical protein